MLLMKNPRIFYNIPTLFINVTSLMTNVFSINKHFSLTGMLTVCSPYPHYSMLSFIMEYL